MDKDQETLFWVVRNEDEETLSIQDHVNLIERGGESFLECKSKVVGLRAVQDEKGSPGVIIYVEDRKKPMILGTVYYD